MNELIKILYEYQITTQETAELAVLVFLRVGAAMATLPALGEQTIPARIRIVIAFMLTAAILPGVIWTPINVATAFIPETLIGLLIGLSLRFFIFALMIAGTIAANATSLAQLFSQGAEPQTTVSQLLVMGGIAVALYFDLHLKIVGFLLMSYDALPVGQWPDAGKLAKWGTEHGTRVFSLALTISMPFMIASLLYNLALGVINRAMPQLMVTFIGAPALSLGGLVLIAIVVPAAITTWVSVLHKFISVPIGSHW